MSCLRPIICSPPDPRRRLPAAIPAILLASLLAACAADTIAEGPAGGAARLVGAATTAPEPAQFVRDARPAGTPDFVPVGVTPAPRAEPKRDEAALKRLEAELDADRDRSKAFARRPVPPSTYDGSQPPRPQPVPKELLPE
ncbi:MAG: hypothetical protein LDL25_01735 [Hyphomicrobiales bacterium]|nr:hypothetical protein [Hyphomicrobiales bacterium]